MKNIKSIGVFCGAAEGKNPDYMKAAEELGRILGKNNITLVYGAGHSGMMGAVAEGTIKEGGKVLGIITKHLQNMEKQRLKLSELRVLDSMHVRKEQLFKESDAFCILPGGLGTLDEVFEIVTLKQLGEHKKPIILYNPDGFYEPYRVFIDALIKTGFVKPSDADLVTYVSDIKDVLPTIEKQLER